MIALPPACGEKACARCQQIKPLTQFSLVKRKDESTKHHSYCKSCRNAHAQERAILGRRKDRQVRKPRLEEIWPRQLREALLDVSAKKWRGPVTAGPLRWAA